MIKKFDGKIKIFADFQNLHIVPNFARSIAEKFSCPELEIFKIMFAVHQVYTNIIKYSFKGNPYN
ncbi:MAG: hypothetical protein ACUVQ1_08355 [Candidatus Kapaibacteriales bacterium]